MNEDIINEDSMGIFTEAQRSFTDPLVEDALTDEAKAISAPAYTPGWESFEKKAQAQIAIWMGGLDLDLEKLSDAELKTEMKAGRKASNFVAAFMQEVLLAVKQREEHEQRQ